MVVWFALNWINARKTSFFAKLTPFLYCNYTMKNDCWELNKLKCFRNFRHSNNKKKGIYAVKIKSIRVDIYSWNSNFQNLCIIPWERIKRHISQSLNQSKICSIVWRLNQSKICSIVWRNHIIPNCSSGFWAQTIIYIHVSLCIYHSPHSLEIRIQSTFDWKFGDIQSNTLADNGGTVLPPLQILKLKWHFSITPTKQGYHFD